MTYIRDHKWSLPFYICICIVIICVFSFISIMKQQQQITLIAVDQETGEEYIRTQVEEGDRFIAQWIHSVEKEMWKEVFQVNENGEIVLVETRFRSYGSGVPSAKDGSNVYIEDGFIVITDLSEVKEFYQWIHSHQAEFTMYKNDEIWIQTEDIPHHHKATLVVQKG